MSVFAFRIVLDNKNYWNTEYRPSVAQVDALSDWRPGGRGFNPRRGRQHSFVEIDHEIFSTVVLSLPLIQEGQLSVSGKRMRTILVNGLEDSACPVNWPRSIWPHWVDWAIKPQHKQTDPDPTVQMLMHRQNWAFAILICYETLFIWWTY